MFWPQLALTLESGTGNGSGQQEVGREEERGGGIIIPKLVTRTEVFGGTLEESLSNVSGHVKASSLKACPVRD